MLPTQVGPSGVGKSQFCYQLTLALALPRSLGGVERVVMYVDTEGKFSAKRLEELVAHRWDTVCSSSTCCTIQGCMCTQQTQLFHGVEPSWVPPALMPQHGQPVVQLLQVVPSNTANAWQAIPNAGLPLTTLVPACGTELALHWTFRHKRQC